MATTKQEKKEKKITQNQINYLSILCKGHGILNNKHLLLHVLNIISVNTWNTRFNHFYSLCFRIFVSAIQFGPWLWPIHITHIVNCTRIQHCSEFNLLLLICAAVAYNNLYLHEIHIPYYTYYTYIRIHDIHNIHIKINEIQKNICKIYQYINE